MTPPADASPPEGTPPTRGATFSPGRRYRYALWRDWGSRPTMRRLVVIGLNPSTADEQQDDPTIRRCVGFAKRECCDGLVMVTLFAFRATDPQAMKAAADPVGPENDATLAQWCRSALVVAAWGVHGGYRRRSAEVVALLADITSLECFGLTKDGYPRHPLYLSSAAPLVPYATRLAHV